ncbi:MAG: c-type cytochrome [Bacteroidota bacterium]
MKKHLKTSLIIFVLLYPLTGKAQGEQLFKAKCNTCHMLEKNSTGPNLKGVKQKWQDAGEGDLLYEWVANSEGLIASGKSKMAMEIKDFSPSPMSPQQLSKDEIDAVLAYVDSYTPPPPVQDTASAGGTETVTSKPNYKDNLDLFYWLSILAFIQLLAILLLSNAIISLVKSDFFRNKIKEGSSIAKTLAVLLALGLLASPQQALALQFTAPGKSTEPTLWLLVENSDIYFLLAINGILLLVLLYLRGMFRNFLYMVKPKPVKAKREKIARKINRVLTDTVPIEQESKIMLHHEYDGIRELDNNLPPWWVWGFVATVVFAIVYLFNYHVFKTSDLQLTEYEKDMKKSEREVKAYLAKMAMNVDETNATLLTAPSDVSAGKSVFQANCVTCHNPNGEGNIGPNLTDKQWIYGFDIKDLFRTIKTGTPNGMPEHNSKLNPVQIQQVGSYILQLPETKGKEAEGTITEK